MAWYVVLTTNPTQASGDVTASVQQFADAAAFQKTTGTTPMQMGVPGQTDQGYPTQAAAQAVADKYNQSGAGKGATGGKPLAPSAATVPGISNPLSGLQGIATMLGLIGKLFSSLFDPAMWWSLGWLFAGLVLFAIGTWMLAGKPQLPAIIPV